MVVVAEFVVAELRQPGGQFGIGGLHFPDLVGIMFLDDAFDRLGAGVGAAFLPIRAVETPSPSAAIRHTGAISVGRDMAFAQDGLEGVEVRLLLAFHAAEIRAQILFRCLGEDGRLAAIDVHRRQFAGMVDAQHLMHPVAHGAMAGAGR